MASNNPNILSVNFSGLVFLVLLILKLSNTVAWSWWIITLPLTLPLAVMALVLVICGLGAFIQHLLK